MAKKHEFSEKWTERHLKSLNRWSPDCIGKKIAQREPFDNNRGWTDLDIKSNCGYCDEFLHQTKCRSDGCPLFGAYCATHEKDAPSGIFWSFVAEMCETNGEPKPADKIDWQKAEGLRQKMFERMKQDTPT